jgi:hypothetical protein
MIDVHELTRLATYLVTHTTAHELPAPISAEVRTASYSCAEITVRLDETDLPTLAAGLVSWVASFDQVDSLRAWRASSGAVHINAVGTVDLPTGPVTVKAWGCTDHPALTMVGEQFYPLDINAMKSLAADEPVWL